MHYRKFYEEKLCLVLKKDEEVHHLDRNRDNNCIENLVAIPRKLHKQYHLCLTMCEFGFKHFYNCSDEIFNAYYHEIKKWNIQKEKLKKIEKEIDSYIKKRNSLLLEVI